MGDLRAPCAQRTRPLGALVRTARTMATQRDPVEALWTLICAIREDLDLDRVGVFEYDPDAQVVMRLVGVDPNGDPEYTGPKFDITKVPGPLSEIAQGKIPYYLTDDANRDYPELRFMPGVKALAVVPIITGGQLLGMLGTDQCRTGRPIPETLIEPLFLCAGLAAQSLFARYQQKERDRLDALRRGIYTDVFQAATNGKVRLRSHDEMAAEWPSLEDAVPIEHGQDVAAVRDRVRATADGCGMEPDRAWDLTLCASEAATNALRHGNGGLAAAECRDGLVRVKFVDRGRGIPLEDLPDATLRAGWSRGESPSMGHGFSLMYQLADCLYLNTGLAGTVLILEMQVNPQIEMPENWDRLM